MSVGTQHTSVRSLCTQFTQLQVVETKVSEVVFATCADQKSKIRDVMMSPHKSMADLSRAIFEGILGDFRELKEKIDEFWAKYPEHHKSIKKSSWTNLKESYGDEMMSPHEATTCSMADFRIVANAFIDSLTSEIGRRLGLPVPVWIACGTNGYSSDVDVTVQIQDNPANIEDAVFYKTLRDCLHIYVFGGSSRLQLHTESYIPHPAQINILDDLHSTVAHQYFQTGEKASVLFQQYLSLHTSCEAYQKSKKIELESISDAGEREAMQFLYGQVEALMTQLDKKIADVRPTLSEELPDEEVQELVYIPLRLRLAERCSSVQERIKTCVEIPLNGSCDEQYKNNNVPGGVEALCLELQKLLTILAVLQNEGTISAAEGKATLLEEGGQIHANMQRDRRNSVSKVFDCDPEAVKEATEGDPSLRRRLSLTAGPGKSSAIAIIACEDEVKRRLRPGGFKRPTCLTCLLAAFEESMQLQHEVLDGFAKQREAGSVAIGCSKYALRVTHNLTKALEEFTGDSKELKTLKAKAARLELISSRLEKCKRARVIDSLAAATLLTNIVMDNLVHRGNADELEVKPKIRHLFESFDPPKGEHCDPLMPQRRHLEILCNTLREFKGMYVDLKSSEIRGILAAHAGYDRYEYPALTPVHQKASQCTLEELNLTTEDQVICFVNEILSLGADIRNMARENHLLAISTIEMSGSFNFSALL